MDTKKILHEIYARKRAWENENLPDLRWPTRRRSARIRDLEKIRRLAQAHLAKGEEDKAIAHAVRIIDEMMELSDYHSPELYEQMEYVKRYRPTPRGQTISKVIDQIHAGQFHEAQYELFELGRREGDEPSFLFISAVLSKAMGKTRDADELYSMAVSDKIRESGFPLEFYNESRNKVYTIRWKDFPAGLIYAKEYREEEVAHTEFANTYLFRQFLGECVQRPIVKHYDKNPLAFFRAAGDHTLQELLMERPNRKTVKFLKQAAKMLAHIHVFGTKVYRQGMPPHASIDIKIEDPVNDDSKAFTSKIIETLLKYSEDDPAQTIQQTTKEKLLTAHDTLNHVLKGIERDFYKDHNPRNIIIGGGQITAIDFETSKMLPCQIDLISLLEFGPNYLTEKQRKHVIESYIKRKEQLSHRRINRGLFMYHYAHARVQRHLELAGYRSRDSILAKDELVREEELSRKRYHLASALHASHDIKEMSEKSSTKDTTALYYAIKETYDVELKRHRH